MAHTRLRHLLLPCVALVVVTLLAGCSTGQQSGVWSTPVLQQPNAPSASPAKNSAGPSGSSQSGTQTAGAGVLVGDSLLVIAPHPDDEALGAGGAIYEALHRGMKVNVIYMTIGDGYKQAVEATPGAPWDSAQLISYGRLRATEVQAAMAKLGLERNSIWFLGFPDQGLSGLWLNHWDPESFGRGSNGSTFVPYEFAYRPQAP
jgi:hypothetical protein